MSFAVRLTFGLALSFVFSACGQGGPTPDPSRVLHVVNRTTSALAVEITGHSSSGTYDSAVRPCEEFSVVAGSRNTPSSGDVLVTLMIDPTKNLDLVLAQRSTDPYEMSGTFSGLSILWSTGELKAEELPRWIVVTATGTSLLTAPSSSLTSCAALPSPTAP